MVTSGGYRIFQTRGVRHQPLILGQKPIIWQGYCLKLHENERSWTGGGGVSLSSPNLNPPMDICLKQVVWKFKLISSIREIIGVVSVFRARSHLATATQIFVVVTMSSKMGCIVINVTVRTWRQKKNTSLSPSANGPLK